MRQEPLTQLGWRRTIWLSRRKRKQAASTAVKMPTHTNRRARACLARKTCPKNSSTSLNIAANSSLKRSRTIHSWGGHSKICSPDVATNTTMFTIGQPCWRSRLVPPLVKASAPNCSHKARSISLHHNSNNSNSSNRHLTVLVPLSLTKARGAPGKCTTSSSNSSNTSRIKCSNTICT